VRWMRSLWAILSLIALAFAASVATARQPVVERIDLHRRAGVATAWLSNGPCVHVRPMRGSGRVMIVVCLAGGELTESPAERWHTRAAAAGWRPAAGGGGGRGGAEEALKPLVDLWPEGMVLHGSAPSARAAELAEQMARMLVDPQLNEAAVEAWRSTALDGLARRVEDPGETVTDAVFWAMAPSVRLRTESPTPERVLGITPAQARQRLERLVHESPIEAAIVGDVALDDGLNLASRLFRDVPARGAIGPDSLAHERTLDGPLSSAPRSVALELGGKEAGGGWSYAVIAYPGPAIADLTAVRGLNVASRIVTARVRAALAEAGLETDQVSVRSVPARSYRGLGLVLGSVRVRGGEDAAQRAVAVLGEAMSQVAPLGLPAAEVEIAGAALAADARRRLATAEYWASVLPITKLQGLEIDRLADAPRDLEGMTAAEAAGAWAIWCAPARRIDVRASEAAPARGQEP